MANELEKTFFDMFGIKPKYNDGCKLADKYWANEELADEYITFDNYMNSCCTHGDSGACFSTCEYAYDDVQYPQITDRILLELICIYNQYSHPFSIYGKKKEFLRDDILEFMINILNYFYAYEMEKYSKLKHQVHTLFEDGQCLKR